MIAPYIVSVFWLIHPFSEALMNKWVNDPDVRIFIFLICLYFLLSDARLDRRTGSLSRTVHFNNNFTVTQSSIVLQHMENHCSAIF